MKIALVIERFEPMGGGAERSTLQIARELIRRGNEVTVLTGDSPPEFELEGGTIRRAGTVDFKHKVKTVAFARWARRQIVEGDFDTSLSVTTAVPAAVVQPRAGTVKENIDRNIAIRRSRAGKWFKMFTLITTPRLYGALYREKRTIADPLVKKFVAVSGYVADQLRRHYNVSDDRIEVIHNAAEMPILSDEQRAAYRKKLREGFNISDDTTVFLFASYNPKLKGAAPLMRALCHLKDEGKDVVAMIAGSFGFKETSLAATLGVRDVIRVVGPTNRMEELYSAADVTVLPTYYDAASKVVIESLMMGVPAITTGYNGAADLLFANRDAGASNATGKPFSASPQVRGRLIADPNDIGSLVQAMEELMDPIERAKCAAATAGLEEVLSMKRHVEKLEAVLEATC